MKIAIAYNNLEAFWNHFEPKGLKLMCSRTPSYAMECIVAGDEKFWQKSRTFPELCVCKKTHNF